MTESIFNQLKAYGLVANQAVFERALMSSRFFAKKVEGWALSKQSPAAFEQILLKCWLGRFDNAVTKAWLDEQVSSLYCLSELFSGEAQLLELMRRLRLLRQIFQVRAIYRECLAVEKPEEFFLSQMAEYSNFAAVIFQYAEIYIRDQLVQDWCLSAVPEPLIIFGLGKLGAGELNLSSDVDLIFAYDHRVIVQASRDRDAAEFYTRIGQRLIKFLGDVTGEGFVFRIDMRLRPFGQSGALVWSTQALETYYEQQGRMWERYAWIKSQPLTGGVTALRVLSHLRPFVYRRYVDFGLIESLREMKSLIEREVNRTEAKSNIKIGRGGIREVEFIIQVVQLIRGGELSELQQPSLMKAMDNIRDLDVLPSEVLLELREDYIFLRRLEHFLQAYEDRQTQTLPTSDEQWGGLLNALQGIVIGSADHALRIDSRETLELAIARVRDRVHYHFQQTIRPADNHQAFPESLEKWEQIWPDNLERLSDEKVRALLIDLRSSRFLAKASEISKHRLDVLMPMMLSMLERVSDEAALAKEATLSHQLQVSLPELEMCWSGPEETLKRFIVIIESILRRSAYLSLLIENPSALHQVIRLCGMSTLLPQKLARYPSLLDELVDDSPVYQPPSRGQLIDELRQQLVRVPEDDFEQQMARLRAFKQRHTLRAALADIAGQLSLMNVSDYLTWLAEALLQAALDISWRKLTLKYGEPSLYPGASMGFVIVGYGKLGGIELSYTSDLDIVFLYDSPPDGVTEGLRSIENSLFYMQLVKNLNHILMTDTLDGRLYEIDMRLRPSGSAGLFVSTFEGFRRYQEQDAWVWERQALVRARPVAGDAHLFRRFNELRLASLISIEKNQELTMRVLEMSQKMRSHLQDTTGKFDLKYSSGGLVDIEFLAQHLVLTQAHQYPVVAKFSDNVRIFEVAMTENIISKVDAEALIHAYLLYRALIHRLSFQGQSLAIEPGLLVNARADVERIFKAWFKL